MIWPASFSFAPSGLVGFVIVIPRLAPWAAFFRRFAAEGMMQDEQILSGWLQAVELRSTGQPVRLSRHKS
jgi:hypothetical protein